MMANLNRQEINSKIIQFVKENTILWLPSLKENSKMIIKRHLWTKIGEEVNMDGPECSVRFRYLRDTFVKTFKRTQQLNKPQIAPTWVHYHEMAFLLPTIHPNYDFGNMMSDDARNGQGDEMFEAAADQDLNETRSDSLAVSDESGGVGPTFQVDQMPPSFSIPIKVEEETATDTSDCEQGPSRYREARKRHCASSVDSTDPKRRILDEHESFLLSLAPGMNHLADRQLNNFKQQVILLLQSYRDGKIPIGDELFQSHANRSQPKFDGQSDVHEFLSDFDSVASINDWDEDTKMLRLPLSFRGTAAKWYQMIRHVVRGYKTWDEWRTRLIEAFGRDQMILWMEMMNRRYREDESVMTYYYDKLLKCDKITPVLTDDMKAQVIFEGLPVECQKMMAAIWPLPLQHLLPRVKTVWEIMKRCQTQKN